MSTSIVTSGNGQVRALSTAVPEPGPNEILIKVAYSTLGPFDLYQVDAGFLVPKDHHTSVGLNASGTVAKVGSSISDLKEGDKVTAFTFGVPNAKGLQEYTVASRSAVAKIPEGLALQDAVTVPDNFITAFHALFTEIGLPWSEEFPKHETPVDADQPIVVYGAGATSGQYTVRLLKLAGYTNIIAIASSRNHALLRGLGAAHVFDYNNSSFTDEILATVGDQKVKLVVDCVALDESFAAISKFIAPGGRVAYLVPMKQGGDITGKGANFLFELPETVTRAFPEGVKVHAVRTFTYQNDERVVKSLMPTILPHLLEQGLIQPNEKILVENGSLLDRVNKACQLLREGKTSGKKVVIKVQN